MVLSTSPACLHVHPQLICQQLTHSVAIQEYTCGTLTCVLDGPSYTFVVVSLDDSCFVLVYHFPIHKNLITLTWLQVWIATGENL